MELRSMNQLHQGRPRVTIVTPVFNEQESLAAYEERVRSTLLDLPGYDVSIVLVDDGSSDRSWEMIADMCRRDARIRGLRLSRNFGSHAALAAGLHHATGDAIAILACDLQDPPEVVLQFLDQWRAGFQIVWGRRRTRADSGWRIWASKSFDFLTRRYAMPAGSKYTTGSFLLMDRRVLECYRQFHERRRVTFALVAWTGFRQAVVDYDRQARQQGQSAWKLKHLVAAAYDTFLGFSKVPFGFMTAIGAGMFCLSIPVCCYLLWCYVVGNPQPGWTSLMMALVMFFGLQFMFMSVLGEYLSRIYCEAVGRPIYFVGQDTCETQEHDRAAA
jgi:dolichol-phosphate mannosyltransferase